MSTIVSLSPVALELFGLNIHWYGLLYLIAFAAAWILLPRLQRYRHLALPADDWLYVLAWGAAGVLIGGRLGYVLLYEPMHYAAHPLEIPALWRGGMSFHGGLVGVGSAMWLVSRRIGVPFLALFDVLVVPAALGLALGRVGNFINQELFDPPDLALLAAGKNIIITGVCWWILARPIPVFKIQPGSVVAAFLVLYGVFRFLIECVRIQEWPLVWGLTRGQLYSLPVMAAGLWLVWKLLRIKKQPIVRDP